MLGFFTFFKVNFKNLDIFAVYFIVQLVSKGKIFSETF